MAQSHLVADLLARLEPPAAAELVPIVTRGDQLRGPLTGLGGKGLFTEELEAGLRTGDLDLAVHSLKDLPVTLGEELELVAFPERGDPRDALVSETATSLGDLPDGGQVLTGSLRRRAQLLALRPDLRVEPVRGNVETRIRKWRQEGAAGLILAMAGIERLGLADLPVTPLDPLSFVPAPGQGALAIEVRRESAASRLCRLLDHPPTARAVTAERWVVEAFGGDCTLPLAAWARPDDDGLELIAFLGTPGGELAVRARVRGATGEEAAHSCVAALRSEGAQEVLSRLGRAGG